MLAKKKNIKYLWNAENMANDGKYGERRSYAIFTNGPRGHRAP
mgnify:CR=1 FL=1